MDASNKCGKLKIVKQNNQIMLLRPGLSQIFQFTILVFNYVNSLNS